MEKKPRLKIELAIEKYKAVGMAGLSPEEFKKILKKGGIKKSPSFLSGGLSPQE